MIRATTLETATVRRYWSRNFVVALRVQGTFHKLFQVVFTAKDGSLFLTFPYFKHTRGIAAEVPSPPRAGAPDVVPLQEVGWKTNHRVKYSHHPSGEAHFSQTGKVGTYIRKESVRLTDVGGHLFSLYLKGVTDFERLKEPKDLKYPLEERTTLLLNAPEGDPGWFRLVGRWYTLPQFVAKHRAVTGIGEAPITVDALFAYVEPDGRESQRVLLSPSPGTASADSVLELLVEGIGDFDPAAPSTFLFLGGFDRRPVSDEDAGSSTYLALKYPASTVGEVWDLMRTIDLPVRESARGAAPERR